MWVGIILSVEGLDKTKGLAFPQVRQNFSCSPAFKQEHQFSSAFDSSRNTDSSWVKPADLHIGTTPSALLSAQLVDSPYIFWDLASLIIWANPLYLYLLYTYVSFPGGSAVKNYLQCRRCRFDPWVGNIPWRQKWQPTPVFLPGESHAQRRVHRVTRVR